MALRMGTRTTAPAAWPPVGRWNRRASARAVFPIPRDCRCHPASTAAYACACMAASGLVNWGGTPLPAPPSAPPTAGRIAFPARLADLVHAAGGRAAQLPLARRRDPRRGRAVPPGPGRPVAVRADSVDRAPRRWRWPRCAGTGGGGRGGRRGSQRGEAPAQAGWLFAIAALNFACWALITPPFQAPDEVDHFAYTQSLVERGEAPSRNPGVAAAALVERGDAGAGRQELLHRPPGRRHARAVGRARADRYRGRSRATHPSSSDGGGNETAATHGPIYYAALAPAYCAGVGLAASRS